MKKDMEIIAEAGQNHNGDMQLALEMIDAAKENGADVVKFQVYDARKVFPRTDNPWFSYNCRTELKRDQIRLLSERCKKRKIEFMASVFDVERIEWLEEAGVRRYKIASRSLNDRDLVRAVSRTGKPLIVSLGMWGKKSFPRIGPKEKVKFLYCVSKYPVPLSEMHLGSVDFKRYAGLSDHSIGLSASLYALTRGAQIIEKHFTLNKNMYGPDHSGSMTPGELKVLCRFRDDLKELV